ncbi:hypothetical protein B0H13DRAFT_1853130 [Mycena leptocephala]|nr:hypothetical protein B0H13DRAFT_1853130 [Mycena leptocephala]
MMRFNVLRRASNTGIVKFSRNDLGDPCPADVPSQPFHRSLSPGKIGQSDMDALVDYTYFMDEADKKWLDNANYQCRVEEQIAQETPSAETDAWIRPPSVLSSIALTIHPHWQQRRSLRGGRKIFSSLNSEENDYINAAYVCFRDIPTRRTRAQNLKVGKGKVGWLQADSSAQHLANGRRVGKEPSCATSDDETKVPVGSGVAETATQNGTPNAQPAIKHKVSGTRKMKSHTHNHSVTATEQTVSPGPDSLGRPPNIPQPVGQSEKVVPTTT